MLFNLSTFPRMQLTSIEADTGDERGDKALKVGGSQTSNLKDLVMVGRWLTVVVHDTLVCDEWETDTTHWTLTVTSHDHLRTRAHTWYQNTHQHITITLFVFTALHTQSTDEHSVRPSVCPSVCPSDKRVNCDKTEEKISPDFYRAAWNAVAV